MKQFLWICLIVILSQAVLAQEINNQKKDFELWSSVSVSTEIMNDLSIDFKQAYRLDNNATDKKLSFSQIALSYKLNKTISFTSYYRFIYKEKGEIKHRMSFAGRFKKKIKRFGLSYRLRYEKEWESANFYSNTLRNKFQVKYKPKKKPYSFYLASELFYEKNYMFSDFNKLRYKLGADYEIMKSMEIGLGYMIQQLISDEAGENDFIFIVDLAYKF